MKSMSNQAFFDIWSFQSVVSKVIKSPRLTGEVSNLNIRKDVAECKLRGSC